MLLLSLRYSMYRQCLAISLFFLAFIAFQAAAQQQPAGRVTVVLGTVEAVAQDGDVRRLSRGDSIFEGDTLRSGPRGRAQVRFTDRGMLSLRPNSEVALDEYNDDAAAPSANRKQMSVSRGGFRTRTGNIARVNREAYRVQTPLGAIGIRGTTFELHQEPGGALLLGATEGVIEVVTISGAVGRIGEGESFNYLRVNPDGSIDYLLDVPEPFTGTPDLSAGDRSETLQVGDAGQASIVTGAGAAESTAGLRTLAREDLLDLVDDPESTGIVSRARVGSGDIPGDLIDDDPELQPDPQPVLTAEQIEALVADDRIALALGAAGATTDEDGNLVLGPSGLFGGIATVNSPILALDSSTEGFVPGIAGADRQGLLDGADLFLLGNSGEVLFEEDVAGIEGLVWGRFTEPVTVFIDALDRDVTFGLERDVLFAIGSPADLASLEGVVEYELFDFDAVSSGLPIAALLGSGTLDLGAGTYTGSIEVILGEGESVNDFGLLAEFESQVVGGVLEGVEFIVLELRPFNDLPSENAEGTLAGFFTGDAGAFLQLAFDFRVPSRDDADALGLVLLEQVEQIEDPVLEGLTPEEADALSQGFAWVGVSCCEAAEGVDSPEVYAGLASDPRPSEGQEVLLGIALGEDGEHVGPLDPAFLAFPPALVVRGSDSEVFNYQPSFHIVGAESLAAFTLDRDGLPLRAFDTATGDLDRLLGEGMFVLTGMPTSVASLEGTARYELTGFTDILASPGTLDPDRAAEFSFNIDFASGAVRDGVLLVPLDFSESSPDFDVRARAEALFAGQVASASGDTFIDFTILEGRFDFIEDQPDLLDLERSSLSGFFSGDEAEAFAAAFHLESAGENFLSDSPNPLLVLGTAILGERDLSLSPLEGAALADSGLVFVGAACCGEENRMFTGRATGNEEGMQVLGINVDAAGNRLRPGDAGFLAISPQQLLRRGSSLESSPFGAGFGADFFSDTDVQFWSWRPFRGPALRVDAETGTILETFGTGFLDFADAGFDQFFFLTATPSSLGALEAEGFTTFAGTTSLSLSVRGQANTFGRVTSATASFNVDLTTGELFAGHLFVRDRSLEVESALNVELGWELFFTGQVVLSEDGSFVEFDLQDGSYAGRVPLDLDASRIEGFFAGEGDKLFNASFLLRSEVDAEGEFAAAGGVFGVGNTALVETRLIANDVATWVRTFEMDDVEVTRPGIGLAAFSAPLSDTPGQGLLLGRAGPVVSPDIGDAPPFVLGANALRVFGAEGQVLEDTRRGDFLAQPFDFVLRQGPADTQFDLFEADVRPGEGAPDFAGFEVSWGAWEDIGSDTSPRVQDDPADSGSVREVGPEVFFASVNPTPVSQIPRQGSAAFGGEIAFIGGARGNVSASGPRNDLGLLEVSFDLDFASGLISGGELEARYSSALEPVSFTWEASFDGFLNGAVTDLNVLDVTLRLFSDAGPGSPLEGDYSRSNLTGVLTGPMAERHAGGFSLQYVGPESFESVEGLWVLDQIEIGDGG